MSRARLAFAIAAAVELLVVGVLTVSWPAKAAEGAVPIAIIVSGLAGVYFPGPWYRVALLGAALGLVNAGAFILMSSPLGAPGKFTVAARITISIGFAAGTALATWLWAQYERRRTAEGRRP